MTYLLGYFAIGEVIVLVHLVRTRSPSPPDPEDGWFFNYVLLPVLVVVLLPALWPLVIYWKVHELFFEKKEISLDKEFSVTRVDLLQRMDINEIEEQEYVVDPLGAVPTLPFGHLNAAWLKFIDNLDTQDELWTFSKQWSTGWGGDEIRSGYVILHGDNIGHYFLTTWKSLDED